MTLVVALQCTNGVVIAADSASTDMEGGTKQPSVKIRPLGNLPILVGGSGDVGLLQKIHEAFAENEDSIAKKGTLKSLRQELRKVHATEASLSNNFYVPMPGQQIAPPDAVLLFAGRHHGKWFVLEINQNASDTQYDADMGGFYAIGSGKPLAQAIFRPHLYETDTRTLEVGKVLAYRVLDDAIDLSHAWLATPINIFTISDNGIKKIEADESRQLQDTCSIWRQLQRDCLGEALGNGRGPDTLEELRVPLPRLNS